MTNSLFRRGKRRSVPAFFAIVIGTIASLAAMQGAVAQPSGDAAAHVPSSSIVSARIKPAEIIQTPAFELLPIEVAQAWSKENLGVDPLSINEIQLVVGMPMGPGAPPFGAVVKLKQDFDPSEIDKDLLLDEEPQIIAGRTIYRMGDGSQDIYVHSLDPRTVLIAVPGMFQPMAAASEGEGPLAQLVRDNPLEDAHLQVIVAVEPVRPMLSGVAAQGVRSLPAEIQDLGRVPELVEALVVEAQLEGSGVGLTAAAVCGDAERAGELLDIVNRSIDFGRAMFVSEMNQEIPDEGPVPEAQRAYAQRLADYFVAMLKPEQKNDRLVLSIDSEVSIAYVGMVTGLLLPAVQAAREAARRMNASNNLKQIGLAMHNYHSAYRHFPPPAIRDDEGKPLLSWRVAILPFVEQQELYEQFHLDEPWDSPHNIKLVEKMPTVFVDPSVPLQPGQTVFQAAVGEKLAFRTEEETQLRDLTDGTSNTILVVEADAESAVPWSAPQDVDIDLEMPLQSMGRRHSGGFHVLFGDGSVRFIVRSIDPAMFKAMLTRDGGERIGGF